MKDFLCQNKWFSRLYSPSTGLEFLIFGSLRAEFLDAVSLRVIWYKSRFDESFRRKICRKMQARLRQLVSQVRTWKIGLRTCRRYFQEEKT